MSIIDNLKQRSVQIKDASQDGEITPTMVGSLLEDTIDYLGTLPKTDSSEAIETINEALATKVSADTFTGEVTRLNCAINDVDRKFNQYYTATQIDGMIPEIENEVLPNSDRCVTSGAVYEAINGVTDIEEGEYTGGYSPNDGVYWARYFDLNRGDSVTVTVGQMAGHQVYWSTTRPPRKEVNGFTYTASQDNIKVFVGFLGSQPSNFTYTVVHKKANTAIDNAINDNAVLYTKLQNLSTTQQNTARENLSVYSRAEVDALIANLRSELGR